MANDDNNTYEQQQNYDDQYWANKSPEDTANVALSKADSWFLEIDSNGYLDKLKVMWAAYYGAYFTDFNDSHQITFSGEQGELVNLSVNHLRNLAQHMKNIITATRPSLQARATNTDHKSLVQARLANGLLDYYMREKRLETYLDKAIEQAIVMGQGYVKMEWNATKGQVYDINEELGIEEKEGDIEFSNPSPFDVVFDVNREDNNHDWVICRSFKLKYDFIAKYPEYKEQILNLPTKSDIESYSLESRHKTETDLIPVYELYHKRTESMPNGRYMVFLDSEITLLDSPLPYRELPIYRVSPSDILGTPYGYTPLFDIIPIQDAINSLYSTILTNQNAFGVQNILVPRGADVGISEFSGSLNIIEANTQYGDIKPLNLTATPREVFEFLKMLEQVAETISGVNSVTRGQPESSLKSGTALALVQSMSIQFMSGLQQSYVMLMEDVGTGLINMLKDYASVPRVAMIVGKNNQMKMREFSGSDLSQINRVIVDIGNPLSKTTAGRVQMAEQFLQMGLITTPEQYELVLTTGKLETMTEGTQDELLNIRKENENLVNNEPVIAIPTDRHTIHIREHRAVLSDPSLRFDADLMQRTLDHINEHLDQLREVDPDLLSIIEEQPLGPVGGSPANQPPNQPPQAPLGNNIAPALQNPQAPLPDQPGMPEMPSPPPPFDNLPVNPKDNIPEG